VDGCRAGWLRIERGADGELSAHVFQSARQLFDDAPDFRVLAIDMPIGLMDDGPRECDIAARRLLGKRGSSVFPAPVRAVLDAGDYRDACDRSLASCGKALSKQSWAIVPRILEIDDPLRADARLRDIVREVHPEVSFTYCNAGSPMHFAKKSGFGFVERLKLLQAHFGDRFGKLRRGISDREAADDDILDAAVALWTAERIRDGVAVGLPADILHDRFALPMKILA
jgi:predicted RNase H-like nuclease